MFKIPKKVKVGGFTYKIIFKDRIVKDRDECLGMCDPDGLTVYIKKRLKKQRQVEVLFHELLHAIESAYGFDLKEEEVNRAGLGIFALLKDNNWLKDEIMEYIK